MSEESRQEAGGALPKPEKKPRAKRSPTKKAPPTKHAAPKKEAPTPAEGQTRRTSPRRRAPAPAIPPIPQEPWDAPLGELNRDELSVFVYVALLPDQTAKLVKQLGLSVPGFRREALGAVQRADLIADEILARPEARDVVLDLLRADFKVPAFAGWALSPPAADELLDVLDHEDAYGLVLWRLLCDPDAAVRDRARPFLDDLARAFYGPADGKAGSKEPPRKKGDGATAEEALAALERKLEDVRARAAQDAERAEQRLAEERRRRDEEKEKLQSQLREARADAAHARDELARARAAADSAGKERARLAAELAAARREDAAVELQRARAQLRDEAGRAAALEARVERSRAREEELEAELEALRTAARRDATMAAGADGVDGDIEDAPASWLMPVYSREFYDSLEGWDRRIQRAAFKQAALLAQDHRHPSLRAIPLEGVPGYYRVRVATDVRLIYRRGEQQNTIEILSLIDREDLDRYVRQAKSRGT